ncbi:MAG: alkene reductase [Ancalomicrobiaceae bacterium]|nr:alkene reductase [Ancalomicrobiaceae bacterium]
MTSETLFSPAEFGAIAAKNRVVMAPMTRNRAGAGNVPTDLTVAYYAQRASAGLIITEATQIVPEGQGYPTTPGIHSPEQIAAWRKVTDAVHAKGGKIALQLWFTGRISHSVYQPGGKQTVSASAIRPAGHVYLPDWSKVEFETPRALETDEIPAIARAYGQATSNAKEAGFDGVEIHAANGYLIDQFLRDGSNKRTDRYGGSIDNRVRFLVEVTEQVTAAWGSGDGVGVRLSPHNPYNDMSDSDPEALFVHAAASLKRFGLAFVHVIEPVGTELQLAGKIKAAVGAPLIINGDFGFDKAGEAVASGLADAVAFGKVFISNPDLVARFASGAELTPPDPASFFGGSEKGYTDYPVLAESVAAE